MEHNVYYSTLSSAILYSVGQGLIVFVLAKLALLSLPGLPAAGRFKLWYAAAVVIFAGFLISLFESVFALQAQTVYSNTAPLVLPGVQDLAGVLPRTFSGWISALYLTGLFVQSLLMFAGFYRLTAIRNQRQHWTSVAWNESLNQLTAQLNIRSRVKLHLTGRIFSPFTAGFLKPVILFPLAMINRLDPEQVEAILLHELAHIRRNDYLLNLLLNAMETILFFNPFLWLIARSIRMEREFACDDMVIAHKPNSRQYAEALYYIAESKLKNCRYGIAAGGNQKHQLFNRIKRITNMETLKSNPKHRLCAVLSMIAACLSLAFVIPPDKQSAGPGKTSVKASQSALQSVKALAPSSEAADTISPPPRQRKTPPLPAPPAPPAPPAAPDTQELNQYFNSAGWQKQVEHIKSAAAAMGKQFESAEWKKQLVDIQSATAALQKTFDSAEWKKQVEEMKLNSEELKAALKKQMDTPEWKKQMEEMKLNAKKMSERVNSEEWKHQLELIKKQAESMKMEMRHLEKMPTDSIR